MALFSGSIPKKLKYNQTDARLVSLVKAVETSEAGEKFWNRDDALSVTQDLARETAEGTRPAEFISKRAALAFSRMTKKSPSLLTMKFTYGMRLVVMLLLVVGAYLLGAFAERFLSVGSEINLFSPVLLFMFGWSAFVYACILLFGLVSILRGTHTELPLRTMLAKLSDGLYAPKLITSGIRQAFLRNWGPSVLRLSQFRIARVLHGSAIAFAVGVLSSIAVRGFGTTYMIGWDLPGLDDAPERVQAIFQTLFGWMSALLNIAPVPGTETVAAMRLDRLALGGVETAVSVAPAAEWIPRIIVLIVLFIVLPRLVLMIWDTIAVKYMAGHVAVPSDPYVENIIRTAENTVAEKPESEIKEETKSEETLTPAENETPEKETPKKEA